MSYRDRDPRDYRPDRSEFESSRPDQYGQEHYGRHQFGQSRYDYQRDGQRDGQRGGWDQQHHGWQAGEQQRGDWRGRDSGGWRDRHPLSQEPSGHEPFSHSAFGESEQPRYFGTGAQGHGGGPSFTGGTYGTADWRSDAPYFDEVGFNRGHYEDPLPREQGSRYRQSSFGQSGLGQSRQQRRYPLGPKGYTRSDERLREDISERLMQSYDIDSSEVTVQVQGGKVLLEGTVPSRYMKHAIEDIADNAPGVQDVDNRVRVTGSGSRWGASQDAGSLAGNTNNPVAGGSSNQSLSGTTSGGRSTTGTVRRDS
jgi:osmotically-inducible protein OsmY